MYEMDPQTLEKYKKMAKWITDRQIAGDQMNFGSDELPYYARTNWIE